jgi:hypothetical protein
MALKEALAAIKNLTVKHNGDIAHTLTMVLMDLILPLTEGVIDALRAALPKDKEVQDNFTLCAVAVQNGIIEVVTGMLAYSLTTTPSKLNLNADGSVVIEAETFATSTTVQDLSVLGPTPAMTWVPVAAALGGLASPLGILIKDITNLVSTVKSHVKKDDTPPLEEL